MLLSVPLGGPLGWCKTHPRRSPLADRGSGGVSVGPRLFFTDPRSMAIGLLRPMGFGDSLPLAKCEVADAPACAAVLKLTSVVSANGECNQVQQWGDDGTLWSGRGRGLRVGVLVPSPTISDVAAEEADGIEK